MRRYAVVVQRNFHPSFGDRVQPDDFAGQPVQQPNRSCVLHGLNPDSLADQILQAIGAIQAIRNEAGALLLRDGGRGESKSLAIEPAATALG